MKIKIIILLFGLSIILTGCYKGNELSEELKNNQTKVISNLEKVNNNDIVVKFMNENEEISYYIYRIDGLKFTQYLYTIHNSEKSYNNFISKYQNNTYYSLEKIDNALVTIIILQKGMDESIIKTIEKSYSNSKKYQIIK